MFKTRYRIVTDSYRGYEAQIKPWWSPFYFQINGSNTKETIEESEKLINEHIKNNGKLVKQIR